tara:strand:- start:7553 stop:7744 length:192 start_codon:yes stop_codon:yes gene_type:complete
MCFSGASAENRYQAMKKTYDPLPSLGMKSDTSEDAAPEASPLMDVRRGGKKKRSLLTPMYNAG